MNKYIFTFLFIVSFGICDVPDSIRLNTNNMDKKSWDIYLSQCYNTNKTSCEIIINDGLKNAESCNAKKECVFIGEIYFNASLDSKDIESSQTYYKKAKDYFTKACEEKNMLGCFYIGFYAEKENKFLEAKELYERACDKKEVLACDRLGFLYAEGNGVRQDYETASILYKKACKGKEKSACYKIAKLFEGGEIEHNLSLAKEFYGKSCDLGYQEGCKEYKRLNKAGVPSLYSNKNVF